MAHRLTDPEYVSKNFRILWSNSVIGLAVVDADGKWLEVNPAFCDLVEYTETELRSKTFYDITHPDDARPHAEMLAAVLRGDRKDYLMAKRYLTKTGGIVWISLRVDRIENKDGSFSHFLSQVQPHVKIDREHSQGITKPPSYIGQHPVLAWVIKYWPQICTAVFVASLVVGWVVELRVQFTRSEEQDRRIERVEELIRKQVEGEIRRAQVLEDTP